MPRTITASDRSALIRLASTMPSGSADRRDLLRFIVASTPLEEQEFKHPETGNKVKFTSLPKEEQAKIRAKMKDKGGDDKGIAKKLSGWMDKAKGLTDAAKKKIQSLPDDAKKFVADPDYRYILSLFEGCMERHNFDLRTPDFIWNKNRLFLERQTLKESMMRVINKQPGKKPGANAGGNDRDNEGDQGNAPAQ